MDFFSEILPSPENAEPASAIPAQPARRASVAETITEVRSAFVILFIFLSIKLLGDFEILFLDRDGLGNAIMEFLNFANYPSPSLRYHQSAIIHQLGEAELKPVN